MNPTNPIILVLYYSRHGKTRKLAELIAQGIESVPGARSAPAHRAGRVHRGRGDRARHPARGAPYVELDDLAECAGLALGSPTRFGNMAAAMKYFLDGTASAVAVRHPGRQAGRVFTSTGSLHGGQESTLLSMMIPLLHHGMMVMGLPYTMPELMTTASGGSPYGATHWSGVDGNQPDHRRRKTPGHRAGQAAGADERANCKGWNKHHASRIEVFHTGAVASLVILSSGCWPGRSWWRRCIRAARGWR